MSLFWPLVLLMLVIGLGSVLIPLWHHRRRDGVDDHAGVEIEDASLAIYQQRLKELEIDQATGALSPEQAESAGHELERELLREQGDELADQAPTTPATRPGLAWTLLVVLLMPALALGLYYQLGKPELANDANSGMPHGTDSQSMERMLGQLQDYLAEHPDDLKGWLLLGRSDMSLKRYDDAARALAQAYRLKSDDPDILLRYADALAMDQGGSLLGRPAELVHQAVALSPEDHTALWLAGMVALERQDYAGALQRWQHLLPMLTDADERQEVQQMIAKAQARAGAATADTSRAEGKIPAAPAAAIEVRVDLAGDLAGSARPDDTLFVYARTISGPPMPLAIVRKRVRDLPLTVTLTDGMAMTPALRLSRFRRVRISARISRSGQAMPQSGDLYGEATDIPVTGGRTVHIRIDRRLP